jgi:hypothetical protein
MLLKKKIDQYAGVPVVTQDPWGRLEIKYAFGVTEFFAVIKLIF